MTNTNLISANINFDKKSDLHSLTFNGMKFYSLMKNYYAIPGTLLDGVNISIFPTSVVLVPYKYVLINEVIFFDRLLTIKNNGNATATIEIEACLSSTTFTDNIGVEAFQALKKELIISHKKFQPRITVYEYTGGIVHLHYTITIPSDEIQKLIRTANSFNNDIDKLIYQAVPNTLQNTRKALNLPDAKRR